MIAYVRDVWAGFLTVLYAMRVTLRHLFTPAVTVQYPKVRRTLPLRSLNRHVLTVDLATGKLKCTSCDACAKVCPTRCITIIGAGKGKERHPVWDVPISIQEEMRRNGQKVRKQVAPGPAQLVTLAEPHG